MSANAQQPGIAVAVDASSVPADLAQRAQEEAVAAAVLPTTIPAAAAPIVPMRIWPMAAVGYLLIALGSILICIIPRFHLAPGFIEGAIACVSMIAVGAGAGLTTWAFVRPMLR